uniref:Uncharacterized protein n=1 Tax=Oryza punctata TaxID=4537 RepID=A0A0E0MDS5_ORYPU
MAEVGSMVSSAVLKVVGEQIGSAISGQISLQQDFSKDLDKMKTTLEKLKAVLKDAERKSIREESVRLWLKQLKYVMYDISDMLDEFEDNNSKAAARKLADVIPCLPNVHKINMANKMKSMRDKLRDIADEHQKYNFTSENNSGELNVNDGRETVSKVEEALIEGRMEEKEKVMASLHESINQGITILPIYGIGGIGKTTLAKLVYNDAKFKNDDYLQAWVYVSRTFDLKKIGNSIISQVQKGDSESNLTAQERINKRLEELLAGKKILIVLDDLWENGSGQLEELRLMLKVNGSNKVIVIVTTRDECIARKIRTIQQPYKLKPLTDDMCWSIIKQKAAFEESDDNEWLVQIGKEIAKKCGGVPLAAQSLGYLLKSKDYKEWESVRTSHIWNVSQEQDSSSPLASLLLSYEAMVPFLKLCFGYCAIFPKGHKIDKANLIRQWISLGFIEPLNNQSPRQLCENYIAQLLGMSFLQYSKIPAAASVLDQDDTTFTMHDLVHDVARSVMVDEVFDASKDNNTGDKSYRYALLTGSSKLFKSSDKLFAKLRAICFIDNTKIELRDVAFSSAKFLRVLDLSEGCVQRLPDSIGQFRLLRYLNAPRVQNRKIPKSITKLSKLNYLILRGSSAIWTLPKSIGEMEGLMYLDLSGCTGIEKLPWSFGKLEKLVHLDLSNCREVADLSKSLENLINLEYLNLSCCENMGKLPEALGNLSKLQYLNLSGLRGLEELPTSFGTIKSLIHLDLSDCSNVKGIPEALSGHTNLQFLNLSKCHNIFTDVLDIKTKKEGIANLNKLQYLNLSGLMGAHWRKSSTQISFFECINTLSNQEHLDLSDNCYLESLPDCFGRLRKLHTLDLSGCWSLSRIPASIGQIDNLKYVRTDGCSQPLLSSLSLLNKIVVPRFVVQATDDGWSSNIVLLQDVNAPKLQITSLENVRSVKEVQTINLMENQGIKELKLEWIECDERFVKNMEVLRELVPPSTLQTFEIKGYNGTEFPAWLMCIYSYLPNLVHITIENIPKCISLPPFCQLPNLEELVLEGMRSITEISRDFYSGPRPFPQLKSFKLKSMENLEVWNTTCSCNGDGMSEFMFLSLCELEISSCPKLCLTACPPRPKKLVIDKSDGVIFSWAEIVSNKTGRSCSNPLVSTMTVQNCNVPLRKWRFLHNLPALDVLSIQDCTDLTIFTEIIGAMSSLQSLSLGSNGFRCVPQLPDWLGQLRSLKELSITNFEVEALLKDIKRLTLLQTLSLESCNWMTTLPHWMGDLTSLKELNIKFCTNLNYLPESIGRLTSLEKLYIAYCESIKSFPTSIEQLTMLKYIHIQGCPQLKQWCELEDNKKKLAHVKRLPPLPESLFSYPAHSAPMHHQALRSTQRPASLRERPLRPWASTMAQPHRGLLPHCSPISLSPCRPSARQNGHVTRAHKFTATLADFRRL